MSCVHEMGVEPTTKGCLLLSQLYFYCEINIIKLYNIVLVRRKQYTYRAMYLFTYGPVRAFALPPLGALSGEVLTVWVGWVHPPIHPHLQRCTECV